MTAKEGRQIGGERMLLSYHNEPERKAKYIDRVRVLRALIDELRHDVEQVQREAFHARK